MILTKDYLKMAPKKYVTISILESIADQIDELIEERGYWPSRGAFVREACIAKIKKEKEE